MVKDHIFLTALRLVHSLWSYDPFQTAR